MSHPKIRLLDRAKETTNTTGSGTIALAGPVNGFVAISGIGNGNSSYYTIEEGINYEVGIGTYVSAGNALSRDQIFSSSNSNYRINLQGSGTVFITYPADKAVVVSSGNLVGIGEVIDPEYQLHVSGTGSFDTVRTNVITPSTNANTITISGNIVSDTGHILHSNVTSIGSLAGFKASGNNSILIGYAAGTGYVNNHNIAMGVTTSSASILSGHVTNSIAIGNNVKSYNYSTVVGHGVYGGTYQGGTDSAGLGYRVLAGTSGSRLVGFGSLAGNTNATSYSEAVAIGYNSYFAGSYGIAIGSYTNSSSVGNNPKSIAIGYSSRADSYGLAIGCHTRANDNNFVLGTGSSATDVMLSGIWGTSLAVLNSRFGINKSSPLSMLHIGCDSASVVGGLIDAAASQVAPLSLWRNSSTANIAAVDPIGGFVSYNASMTAPTGTFATSLSGLWQDQLSFIDNTIRIGTGCATLTNPQSVFIGYAAGSGIQSPCTHNIVIGNEAGYTSSGQYNTLIGSEAGENATGDYNIFLGSQAGLGASGTNYTICIGDEAGKNTPNTCTTNTIIGSQAGENMSGSYCVLLGPNAGKRLIGGAGATFGGSDWSIGLGIQALQDGSGYATIGLGFSAGNTSRAKRSIHIGYQAGYAAAGNYITSLGDLAGRNSSGENNIFIGQNAGWACTGNNNIEIVSEASSASILTSNSNKIHIENTIVGDTSNKKIAIGNVGVADVSPDATLEVKPNASTHVGFIVQGAASQTANLTEWQNSSESVVANVDPSGRIYASGGLLLETGIPAVTTNTIYNSGGTLFFNGSGINEVPPGGSAFTAGTGLLLVGNEFNTAKTGHFDAITFNNIAHIDTSGNATFANITTTGNLNVSGTLTYIDSTTVTIADKQLELASNSGTAAGNDAYVDDGGIVLKSTDGDKKWTWQDNTYFEEWLSSENVGVATNKVFRAGPECAHSPFRLITLNWTNRGNVFLGNPGGTVVPNHASGWLFMGGWGQYGGHGDHGGGVITGVRILDTLDMQASSGDFRHLSISGTPVTFENVGGEAKLGGLGSLSVLPEGASAPLEIKGASNAYISFPDGTSQSTAPTGDIAIVSGLVVSNTGDIATVSGLTVTNASNIGTTGTTFVNATGTLVTNLASTGTTLAASIATNATNIATNTGDIATVSGLVTTYTAGTGLTLVGTEFNTAGTGNFASVAIGTDGYIYHSGDTDTYIQFTDDEIQIAAGGRTYIKIEEDSVDKLILNHGALDIDLQVKGDNDANLIRTDAANDLVGIGKSAPAHKLDVDGVGSFESGIVSTGLITAATGIALQRNTPATTTDKLYNVGGALYFNGSAVDGDTTYTAGSGLTLVGTQFNTADTGNFTKITFAQGAPASTDNVRIGYRAGDLAPATSHTLIAIGSDAARNIKDNSIRTVAIGRGAGSTSSGDYNTFIGYSAGEQQEGDKNVSIGYYCGWNSVGNQNIFIGEEAGIQVDGSNNIEIVTDSSTSPLDNQSNKINVEYTIIGDTSAKKLAIGNVSVADISPDATLEIKPKEHTDIGLIVQGDTSHSANLTEWQNSSETVLASVAADGAVSVSGLVTAATGVALQRNTPATTTDKLYNVGGALYFNGSAVDGDTTYTAGTGLTLVGTEFNTAGTGNFKRLLFDDYIIRIGHDAGNNNGTHGIHIGRYAGQHQGDGAAHCLNVGYGAGYNSDGDYNASFGYQAGYIMSASSDYNLSLGYHAGQQSDGDYNISVGYQAAENSEGDKNIFIGYGAGYGAAGGGHNVEIVASGSVGVNSPMSGLSHKLNIQNIIHGDASTNRIAIGGNLAAADYTPDATLEIKPKEHTDIGLIVQGDTSHSANLTEWQNSSETVVASVAADGDIFTSGTVSATGGMVIDQNSKLMWTDDSVRIGTDAGIMGGLRNISIGQYAGNSAGGGDYNVGIGRYACGGSAGDYNVGVGYMAGNDNDGNYNVGIGYEAGLDIGSSSEYNNNIGYRAGKDQVTNSDHNQSIGYNAGREADGDFNVFLGVHAGYNSAGSNNIYIGYQAGLDADPGSNNIEILTQSVYQAPSTLDGLSNKINIENTIMGDTAANKIVIGTGTTAQTANYSPAATLEIKPKEATDAALIVHSSGLSNVFSVSGTNVSISGRLLGPISAPVLQDTNATVNVALSSGNYHEVELAAAVTKVIFKDGVAGQRFLVRFAQPAGANYTIAWTNVDVDEGGTGGTVSWAAGGTAPTMTATNGKADTYGFIQRTATTFDGFVVGQNI